MTEHEHVCSAGRSIMHAISDRCASCNEEWSYRMAAAYIEELPRFTKKHTLNHTKEFIGRLGSPAADRKVIHVAGTNGKGSVCAYIQAILMAEGKKTGFFTSPHLVSVNERIRFDHDIISDDAFLEVFLKVQKVAGEMEAEGKGHPSYFEFLFGMGMEAFDWSDAEYIILETGLGGRLDATNSVEAPAVTVITSISLDHTDILGDTIEEIASEKAGIIKPGVPVVFDSSSPQAAEVIRGVAEEKQAPCREISKNAFEIQEVSFKSIAFSRVSAYDKDVTWRLPICAPYQAMNASLAIEACECLLSGETVRLARWQKALSEICWEGRMEEVQPHIIVDGAHNPGAIQAFTESVHALYKGRITSPVIIFSAAADKKYGQMIEYLCTHLDAAAYVVTEIEDGRKVPAEELGQVFQRYTDKEVYVRKELKDALETAITVRGEGDVICLGSLYLVGMVKKLLAGGNNYA